MPFEHDYQDFTGYVPAFTLARFLAHAELFKSVLNVPGAIVDIGVGSGGSTFAWAKLCRIFKSPKHVYGFDTFCGFPAVSLEDGGVTVKALGHYNFGRAAFIHAAASHNVGLPITFIEGDIVQTLPTWLASRGPDFRIALLNLDADLYAPTKAALTHLMPRMSPGGVVILDEYDVDVFPGEKRAVNEYFEEQCYFPTLHRFSWCNNPSRYFYT